MRVMKWAVAASALAMAATAGAQLGPASDAKSVEAAFDAGVSSADQLAWLKQMSSEPNQVGSPHDKANADYMLNLFKSWGWDAHIETFQGQRVIIPNSSVYQNPLMNYTETAARRVDIACGVGYGDDLEKAERVAKAAVESIERRDTNQEVELFYNEFGDSSINFMLRFWNG